MTIKYSWIVLCISLFFACEQASNTSVVGATLSTKDQLVQIENKLKQLQDVQKDKGLANQFIELTKAFAEENPQDTLVPIYTLRSAEVAIGLSNYAEAIKLLDKVCTGYRDFSRRPDALFLQGFTYDQELNDKVAAQKHYLEFLKQYPQHPFAKDVKLLLMYIAQDKSAEELVKEFEQQ